MLINRYIHRTAPAPRRCTQAKKVFGYVTSAQAKHITTSALPHSDMALLSVHGNEPDHRSPGMVHRLTTTAQSVALPAECWLPATPFIDNQPIAKIGARVRQLMCSAGAEGMMPGISSSITRFIKCGSHANTSGASVACLKALNLLKFYRVGRQR